MALLTFSIPHTLSTLDTLSTVNTHFNLEALLLEGQRRQAALREIVDQVKQVAERMEFVSAAAGKVFALRLDGFEWRTRKVVLIRRSRICSKLDVGLRIVNDEQQE